MFMDTGVSSRNSDRPQSTLQRPNFSMSNAYFDETRMKIRASIERIVGCVPPQAKKGNSSSSAGYAGTAARFLTLSMSEARRT